MRLAQALFALPIVMACGPLDEGVVEVVPYSSSSAAPIDLLPAQQPSVIAPAVPAGVIAPAVPAGVIAPAVPAGVIAPAVPVGMIEPAVPAVMPAPASIELADLPVVHSDAPARPIVGGTLLLFEESQHVVVADPDRDQLSIADLDSDTLVATVALQEGDEPTRLAAGSGNRVYVVLRGGDALAVLDLTTQDVVARTPTCAAPRGVAYDSERDRVVVACLEGEVVAIDASSLEVAWRATLPSDLRDVVVSEGRYWVSRLKTAELVPVDPEGASFDASLVPETILPPEGSPLTPDGSTPSSPGSHEPRVLRRLLTDAEGNIVLQHQRANRGRLQVAYYGRDVNGSGAIAHGALTLFTPGNQTFSAFGALPNAQIYDVAFSVDGARMAAIATGLDRSYLYETLLSARTELAPTAIGDWTMAEMEGQASAVAYDARGRLLVQSREPALLHIVGGPSISLSEDSRLDTGHIIFHATTPSGLACASCHPEGGEDGMTWDFSTGRRQTQPLYAGVLTTTPLHWQGEFAGIRDLMINTYVTRMQGSTPTDAQAQALGVWLDELPAPIANPPPLDEWQQQGQQVFVATGCATCHAGEHFTDNVAHDVGTGGVFQTPSLIGLRYSAPYMHDGCAATLEQRFDDACGGETHGEFWTLDADQLSQLLAYLHTL